MEDDAIYRIHSMSKLITGVALTCSMKTASSVLMILSPCTCLNRWIQANSTAGTNIVSDGTNSRTVGSGDDSLQGGEKPVRQPTIRDLLRHTAGMTYGVFGNTEVDQLHRAGLLGDMTLAEFTRRRQLPLQYDPGSQWHYSVSVDARTVGSETYPA